MQQLTKLLVLTVTLFTTSQALVLPFSGSILLKRAPSASIFSPAGPQKNNFVLLGCVQDKYPDSRVINGGYQDNPSGGQTIGKCLSFCAGQGYYYAGIENGNQCFCGQTLDDGKVTQPADGISVSQNGGCTSPCQGNKTQSCGGPNRLLVFQGKSKPPSVGTVPDADYKGCYKDNVNQRLLPYVYQGDSNPSMTPQLCAQGCTKRGYNLSGTEYRYQCFCGTSKNVKLGQPTSASSCSSSCVGDPSQICGGPGALTVYQSKTDSGPSPGNPVIVDTVTTSDKTVYKYQGCFEDGSSRSLNGAHSSDPAMTVEKCANFCHGAKFSYSGLEYSTECWCGKNLAYSNRLDSSRCNMGCAGDGTQVCGGGYALTLYRST